MLQVKTVTQDTRREIKEGEKEDTTTITTTAIAATTTTTTIWVKQWTEWKWWKCWINLPVEEEEEETR